MHTHGTEPNGGLGGAAKQVAEHASALARLEIELAKLELGRKVASLGIGIGLGVGIGIGSGDGSRRGCVFGLRDRHGRV